MNRNNSYFPIIVSFLDALKECSVQPREENAFLQWGGGCVWLRWCLCRTLSAVWSMRPRRERLWTDAVHILYMWLDGDWWHALGWTPSLLALRSLSALCNSPLTHNLEAHLPNHSALYCPPYSPGYREYPVKHTCEGRWRDTPMQHLVPCPISTWP